MSAMVVVLPKVWATEAGSLELCTERQDAPVQQRKAPARLRLVQANAVVLAPHVRPVPRPTLPVVPEVGFYRKYTEAMLHRYSRLSMEAGRVPSLLGQEMFRGRVTSYRVRAFDDVVIFVDDMEESIKRLSAGQQALIRRIGVEEYTQSEAAALLGLTLRTVVRRYGEALDRLTRVLLERKMLEPLEECRM